MELWRHLSPERVCLDLKSEDKAGAIAEMAERLRGHSDVPDLDAFLQAVHAREAQSSTGIGRGLAIPHARTDTVRDFVAVVGRSSRGISFDAVDGEPVHLCILMGVPMAQVRDYLKLLAHLTLLLKQEGFVSRLLEAGDAQAIADAFAERES